MNLKDQVLAYRIYLILTTLFITSLVVSNLIFQKFFYWNPFGWYEFEMSVGLLPYPITFLITDIISEIYGKKKANQVVVAGIFASFFSILIVLIGNYTLATSWSPVDNDVYFQVFGFSPFAVFASMLAYLFAQMIDIRVFHFWKQKTNGKHLWLRNNFSTFTSQFIDTFTVVFLLCIFKVLSWDVFWSVLASGVIFKILIALIDTPILYGAVFYFRKRFDLGKGEEIKGIL